MSVQKGRRLTADTDGLSAQIVQAITDAKDTNHIDEPLYNSIDPDALARLFAERHTTGHVTFCHAGCEITVTADRQISVAKLD